MAVITKAGPVTKSPVIATKEMPRLYVLTDMARRESTPQFIQPLPDFSRGHRRPHHYTLKQVKLADDDESKYEF